MAWGPQRHGFKLDFFLPIVALRRVVGSASVKLPQENPVVLITADSKQAEATGSGVARPPAMLVGLFQVAFLQPRHLEAARPLGYCRLLCVDQILSPSASKLVRP